MCGYHKNLFIVGDPDQTIYTWRGANVRYLLDFDKIFPSVKTIMMMQNYRSTPQIVSVVNDLIDKNKFRIKKNLMPTIADGRKVICHHADTSEREAMWIAEQIQALHGEGTSYREITVLYRAHYITRIVEEVFLREKIPYAIYSGVQFFNRMEIKDALAYLRLIAYKDDLAFLRVVNVPKRNLGERRIKFLQEYAVKHQCSLYISLETNLDNEIFKGTKAAQFVALIENFAANYAERQISELLAAILNESGYEKMLRTEAQELLDNLVRSHISKALSGERMAARDRNADLTWIRQQLVDAAWFVRATLEAHGMGVGNESPSAPPETMPDIQTRELVMLIKRLASSLKAVKPDSSVVREAQDWLCDRKLVDITDILR